LLADFEPILTGRDAEEAFASLGRALTLAVQFETRTAGVAQIAGLADQLFKDPLLVLENEHRLNDFLQQVLGRHLVHKIHLITGLPNLPNIDALKAGLHAGRKARNKLVHEFMRDRDPLANHEWLVGFREELRSVALDIAVADTIIYGLHLGVTGAQPPDPVTSALYPFRIVEWVLGERSSLPLAPTRQ
jgi:hypothetical protein